jgi:hypothetical protein
MAFDKDFKFPVYKFTPPPPTKIGRTEFRPTKQDTPLNMSVADENGKPFNYPQNNARRIMK